MLIDERRQHILELIQKQGRVLVGELSRDLQISQITIRKNSFSLVGPLAEDNLEQMHADILFLGVDGFDLEVGITTPNFLESRVNRAMVKAARQVVVVCDSSKFSRRSLSRIVPPGAGSPRYYGSQSAT
jgi:DeoR/GlpR family transcriptional regulator of sugar metabolism